MGIQTALGSLFVSVVLGSLRSENWTHYTVLDSDGIFHLYWNPPGDKSGNNEITFKIELKTKGYFGLGFSPNGGMRGSDIVTGWIKDGEVYFQDRHAIANSLPIRDYQEDYDLIYAYENETFTVFEFSRKLETCDENDTVINENTMRVIYAYSEEDPESDDPFYHRENRGSKSVLLLQNKDNEVPDLDFTSLFHWEVLSPDVDISSFDSLYWCKIFRSPQLSQKHHVVHVKPVIQEGHEKFVHHMMLHKCVGGTPEGYEDYISDRGFECYQPNTPDEILRCEYTITTWAIGGQNIILPENVGLPLDPIPGSYYMLEIHYDNQQLRSGIIDHSGLRFYYTSNLREFDAGDFLIGASFLPRVFIPPGQDKYIVTSHSNEECFGSSFPDGGIKLVAIFLHAHVLAQGVKARHFRGNKELSPLFDDQHYDFNYQVYRYYAEEIEILRGDQITVECTYNSSERNNTTFGGLSTIEEMCLVHMLYYPLMNHYSSHSGPTYANINKVLKTNITQEADIIRELEKYDWESVDIAEVENVMRYSKHETQCSFGEFQEGEVYILKSYPEDLIPYEKRTMCNATM